MLVINPARHAVIEASAGTGKTYTLVELVKELLAEGKAQLEEILLVTFTDKATGELKSRLRKELEALLNQNPSLRATIQKALDSFDQANIYTIHGFCQRVLQDYAFENRQDFRAELVNDADVLELCLHEIQRTTWPAEFGEQLTTILELSGFGQGTNGGASWEKSVLRVAGAFRPRCNHQIRPAPVADFAKALERLEDELRTEDDRLRQEAGPIEGSCLEQHPWWSGFDQLDYRPDWRKPRQEKILRPLLNWLGSCQTKHRPLNAFRNLLMDCQQLDSFAKHGFLLLTDKLSSKAKDQLPDRCPGLQEIVTCLERRRQLLRVDDYENQLAVHSILELQSRSALYKQARGLQSFEDMLTRVDEALDPARNPHYKTLLGTLRRRYRFAIVDEFQDTDPIQWRIFWRLFVEGGGENRLFVVGDPKQAIFGFRGADVHTYLDAKTRLTEEHQAVKHELKINWRSDPRLIDALNHLFEKSEWFGPEGLSFTPVAPAPECQWPYRIESDQTNRPALTLTDLSGCDNLSSARIRMGQFISGEIQRLLSPPGEMPVLKYSKRGVSRALDAGDFCILVAKRKDANPVVAALSKAGIPYSFHKQTGLWQSDEALHLEYLLRAIACAGDHQAFTKALLTRFFRIRPENLAQAEDLPAHHPTRKLLDQWRFDAEQRHWARLFQSIEEDTGLWFDDPEASDADRQRANLRYILQFLQQAAYGQDLDLLGIVELLEHKRQIPSEEEADLQPVETEAPKVKIMTIHASKGLEFPVVFLAGGFTDKQRSGWLSYRDPQGRHQVFDLAPDSSAKQLYREDQRNESCRLYYVALTRAMFKLYLPYISADKKFKRHQGPFVEIIAPALHKSKVASLGSPYVEIIDPSKQPISTAEDSPTENVETAGAKQRSLLLGVTLPDVLFPLLDAELARRRIWVHSFSSLHRRDRAAALEETLYADQMPREDDDEPDILETADPLRGPVFGEMVHDILEIADFEQIGQASAAGDLPIESQSLIEQMRQRHWAKLPARITQDPVLENVCRQQLARLIWHALHTPLAALGGPLGKIPKQDRLHELEFYFPQQSRPAPAEVYCEEGFLTGIMDLVVRKNQQFFLVDWKTNYLPGSYSPEEVRQSMIDSDYILQYRLYLQALDRWLKRTVGATFDLARDFGGVYYLYLRGLNGRNEDNGVFFHKPTVEDVVWIQAWASMMIGAE
jgi:exodeoxyribonuclease V beta subunit